MDNQFVINQEGNTLTIVLGDQLTTGNAPALMEELNGYKGKGPVIEFVNCAADIRSVFEMTGLQNYISFVSK